MAESLEALGLGLAVSRRTDGLEVGLPGGRRLVLDLAVLASPRLGDVDRLIRERQRSEVTSVLVADRLVPRLRERLSAAGWGWLDRRGHLRLVADTLVVDTEVPPLVEERRTRARPVLETVVGLAVASAALTAATTPKSVRHLVSFTGHSLGAVHDALRALKDEKLVDVHGLPVVPDLFWELSARWRPQRVALIETPDEPVPKDGWALCDTVAAARFGAPAVVRGDYPPDFYVPDERAVRVARQRYGDATAFEARGATVAVAPVWWACARPEPVEGERWPVVHPVIAALDLSIDAGRGREILDQWEPPHPYRRVW